MSSPESLERSHGHRKVQKFLEKIDFISLSQKEKVARIRSMPFKDFFALLSRLNGQLRNLGKGKRQDENPPREPTIVMARGTLQEVAYEAPMHGIELLRQFFEQMQGEISQDNLARYAVKLRFAIVSAHPFDEGNGRTSRYTERLLSETDVIEKDSVSRAGIHVITDAALADQLALLELFQDELSEIDKKSLERIKTPDDIWGSYSLSEREYGFAAALKFLALKKTFPDMPDFEITRGKYRDRLQSDQEKRTLFDKNYAELQSKLFWKVQELLDREPDISKTEDSFRKRISNLRKSVGG